MTEISLDFLAEQQARVLGELRSLRSKIDEMRDELRGDMRVTAAIVQRMDGTMQGLVNEVRADHTRFDALARRVEKLEGDQ